MVNVWITKCNYVKVFMAARGYHAVASDMRGYGKTTGARLKDPSKFTSLHLVGDFILLLDAIASNEDKVFVVGHDGGANIAWHVCLYRPDRVEALVNLGVPLVPWSPETSPVLIFRSLYEDDHYFCRFQLIITAVTMEKIEHKIIPVNGLNMHVAELGEGPLVLFIHGFPELWYSWRRQMVFMAERGYRAVEGAAHFVNQERRDEISEHIYAFLKQF